MQLASLVYQRPDLTSADNGNERFLSFMESKVLTRGPSNPVDPLYHFFFHPIPRRHPSNHDAKRRLEARRR